MSPNAGWRGELRGLSQWVQLYTEAQINFGDLTPYLTYGIEELNIIGRTYSGFASVSGRFSGPLADGARGRLRLLERRLSSEGRSDTADPGVVATSAESLFSAFSGSSAVCPSGLLIFCTCDDTSQLKTSCFVLYQTTTTALRTAKTQYRKFETNIPRKETARLQSQFLHSCFCERFIYSPDRSAYSAAGKWWTERGYIYVRRSLTDTWMWKSGLGPRNSFSGNT